MSPRQLLIYGPPGAGKLTVARAIVARCDVHLLDNHVAVDAALRLFTFGEPGFFALVNTIRVEMLEAAARAGKDVVSTFAYAHPVDDAGVVQLLDATRRHGGTVRVAQLLPDDDEIRRRVVTAERQSGNKISDLDLYDEVLTGYDLRTPYPGTDVSIDNTDVAPDEVAEQLAELAGFRSREVDDRGHGGRATSGG